MLRPMEGWRRRSKIEKVDLYSRGTFYVMPWVLLIGWVGVPVLLAVPGRPGPLVLAGLVVVLSAVLAGAGIGAVREALEHYMHRGPAPWSRLAWCAGMTVLLMGAIAAFQAVVGLDDGTAPLGLLFAPVPFAVPLAMVVSMRVFALVYAVTSSVATALLAAAGERGAELLVAPVIMLVGFLLSALVGRPGAWSLSLMWELERAKDAEARLAVAEERLRFGRDLHDVMGRNLAVIALKSELAVQMARRGRPEAVDQMVEVQRLAQEAQHEVREVVRGYREADVRIELLGAEGVLEAAGVRCTVTGADHPKLPAAVQSALGWVVREATTNVLRHGDAQWCAIRLDVTPAGPGRQGRAVLSVENDGAPEGPPGTGGSGLAGLRERLAALGGTLTAEPGERGTFRLTADVPLEGVAA
ncbi:sensor histidine kinase [Streptomyces sp. NPDC060194]|uniref:sensor histidine kinase n=1 Tax=Streptomyces sp. NPDC060194 TaxID=3347069 RepID=UPI0036671CE2